VGGEAAASGAGIKRMKRRREADTVLALLLLLAIAGCIAAVFLRPDWKARIGGDIGVMALFIALGLAVFAQRACRTL
jgi:hypothetical protein